MTEIQKLLVRKSEVRQGLAALGAKADATDEDLAKIDELSTEYRSLEVRERALIVAGDKPEDADPVTGDDAEDGDQAEDGESVELRNLTGKVRLSRYLESAVTETGIDGAEKELREHHRLGDNQVPWSAIAPLEEPDPEKRAVSPAPADTSLQSAAILARVFRRSDAAFLRVRMPMVGVGEANYPVLTSVASEPTTLAKDAGATEPKVTFTANVLSPVRLSASYLWRREDAAVMRGMEEALRSDLSMALNQALDAAIINGNGTAPNPAGFLGGANGALGAGSDQTGGVQTFQEFIAGVAGQVDGLYAYRLADVRALVAPTIYEQMAGAFANSGKGDEAAAQYLERFSAGMRVSGHISDTVASKKHSAIYQRGVAGAAVAPIWEGVTLIRDEITQAKKGQIVVTGIMLYNFKVIRVAQYHRALIQTTA
ncbi:MAG: hypothetical protein F4X36_14080 [Gammaproteobacteria bacterium]|nr:hypothetical protein [Gammaproteobacteria bacterium]